MIDVTALVKVWIRCSNELWMRWFISTKSGASEFPEIELALLNAMVIERSGLSSKGLNVKNFFERLRIVYPGAVDEQVRQHCVVQRHGNVFCSPRVVSFPSQTYFYVRSIDTMGTMEDGRPYIEVKFDDGFILESPDSVDFIIDLE